MKRITVIFMMMVSLIMLLGCTTTKYVEVPVEKVKTEKIVQLQKDSVYVHDSIFSYQRGDTVYSTKLKYIYKYLTKKDTIQTTDTITKTITVTKEVEVNKPTKWQQATSLIGEVCILILLISAFILTYNRIKQK